MRANVLTCFRLIGRWSFKIAVETAAGGVFAHHKASDVGKARRPFSRLSCRRAAYKPDEADLGKCLSGARAKRKNDEARDRETLAQGDLEVEAGRRAGWAVLQTGRVFARRNEDEPPACLLYRTALGRQG